MKIAKGLDVAKGALDVDARAGNARGVDTLLSEEGLLLLTCLGRDVETAAELR